MFYIEYSFGVKMFVSPKIYKKLIETGYVSMSFDVLMV